MKLTSCTHALTTTQSMYPITLHSSSITNCYLLHSDIFLYSSTTDRVMLGNNHIHQKKGSLSLTYSFPSLLFPLIPRVLCRIFCWEMEKNMPTHANESVVFRGVCPGLGVALPGKFLLRLLLTQN